MPATLIINWLQSRFWSRGFHKVQDRLTLVSTSIFSDIDCQPMRFKLWTKGVMGFTCPRSAAVTLSVGPEVWHFDPRCWHVDAHQACPLQWWRSGTGHSLQWDQWPGTGLGVRNTELQLVFSQDIAHEHSLSLTHTGGKEGKRKFYLAQSCTGSTLA